MLTRSRSQEFSDEVMVFHNNDNAIEQIFQLRFVEDDHEKDQGNQQRRVYLLLFKRTTVLQRTSRTTKTATLRS